MRIRRMTLVLAIIFLLILTFVTFTIILKKEPSLDALLQKTTFLQTDLSGDSVIELVFDNTYKIENNEGEVYRLLRDHAIAGEKYIFVIISESGGGSGVFRDLHAVDKQTLRTLDSVAIGDRARIEKMTLIDEPNEILSITFSTKGDAYKASEKVEKTFRINDSNLLEEQGVSP